MRARLLKNTDYPVMPWKNGGGLTKQILIEPEGASLEGGFQWRLSMAEVGSDGPSSLFPEYQRTLLLLEGNGLDLDFGPNGGKKLDKPYEAVSFAGDWQTRFHLMDGPCRDFNVISAKGVHHKVSVLHPDPRSIVSGASTILLFCVRGKAGIAPSGVTLTQEETLRLDEADAIEISALTPDTVIIAVTIQEEKAPQTA